MPLPFPLLVEGVFSSVRFEEVEHGHKGERFGIARSGRSSELVGFVSIVEPFLTVPPTSGLRLEAVRYKGNGKGYAGR